MIPADDAQRRKPDEQLKGHYDADVFQKLEHIDMLAQAPAK